MAALSDIREGLAATLKPIPGLHESAYLLSNPTPPAAEIQPSETEYDHAFGRGCDEWTFVIRVFVGATSDIGAQKRLDGMLASSGASSIKAAVEADPTLGGVVEDLRVTRCTGYRVFAREGGAGVLGAEWEVSIVARGES